MLAVLHRDADVLHMQIGGRNDCDSVKLRIPAHFLKVGVAEGHVQLFPHLCNAGGVDVADCGKLHAGDGGGEVLCVLIAQAAKADRANFNRFHNSFPPFLML
jgi:hypothetical protein